MSQWPTEAHSLRGEPRTLLTTFFCRGDQVSITFCSMGCQAVSSTSLQMHPGSGAALDLTQLHPVQPQLIWLRLD